MVFLEYIHLVKHKLQVGKLLDVVAATSAAGEKGGGASRSGRGAGYAAHLRCEASAASVHTKTPTQGGQGGGKVAQSGRGGGATKERGSARGGGGGGGGGRGKGKGGGEGEEEEVPGAAQSDANVATTDVEEEHKRIQWIGEPQVLTKPLC